MSQRDFDYNRGFAAGEAERATLQLKVDALQALLTAADERADVLEGLLREVQKSARKQDWASGYPTLFASVDAAFKPADDEMTDADWQLKDDMDRYDDEKDQP